jgi:hypothetical protein
MYDAMTLAYSPCKAVAHDWDTIPNQRRAPWGTMLTLRCTCCHSIREDIFDLNGNRTGKANYIQDDDYKNLPSLSKAEWRVIYFHYMKKQGRSSEISRDAATKAGVDVRSLGAEILPMRRKRKTKQPA